MTRLRGEDEVGRREYLGDGVYVAFDGFAVVLTTENGIETTNRIVLDEQILDALGRFVARLREPKP